MTATYKASRFNVWQENREKTLLYNTFTTGLLKLDREHAGKIRGVLEDPQRISALAESEVSLLRDNGFLLEAGIDEMEMLKYRYYRGVFGGKRLTITIIPTTNCNFACPYCFEHNKSHQRLSENDIAEIKLFLRKELKEMKPEAFSYGLYGGEPLLCLDLIERLSSEIGRICRELDIERARDYILTNGYLLTERTADRLRKANIDGLQISIDGNEADHNSTRRLKNGAGTFRQVMDAIRTAERHFSQVDVRINTNRNNYPGVVELIKKEPVFRSPRVNISIGNLRQYMGGEMERHQDTDCFTGREHQQIQQSIYAVIRELDDKKSNLESRSNVFYTKLNYCGADQQKTFFIGPGAAVYKCAERTDPGEEVGCIKNGELVPNQKYWEWFQNNPFKEAACGNCAYLPICMGGCPSARKRLKVPNDEMCGYWEHWLLKKLERS